MPVFNMGAGGSSLSLHVNAYTEFPETAAANTIGIITDTPIPRYRFSSVQPTQDLVEGFVWIKTGTTSTTPIMVDVRKTAQLYPVMAKQYLNGAWTNIASQNVKCFYSGAWAIWDRLIYDYGTQYDGLTFLNNTATYTSGYIQTEERYSWVLHTQSKINVNGYSKLNVTMKQSTEGGSDSFVRLGLYTSNPTAVTDDPDVGFKAKTVGTSTDTFTLSYSLPTTGTTYYPGARFKNSNVATAWRIYKIWLS